MVLFHDTFIMLPVRNVNVLFMEVAMPMRIIFSLYMNVNSNAQVSKNEYISYSMIVIICFLINEMSYVMIDCPPTCSHEFCIVERGAICSM